MEDTGKPVQFKKKRRPEASTEASVESSHKHEPQLLHVMQGRTERDGGKRKNFCSRTEFDCDYESVTKYGGQLALQQPLINQQVVSVHLLTTQGS